MNQMTITKNLLGILLLTAVAWNSPGQKRKPLETPSTVVYALPQTVLKIDVVAEKTIFKRGPFADFSEKYLDIKDIVKEDDVQWELKSVKLAETGEVDPKQFHKITTSIDYQPSLIALTPQGLIQGFNLKKQKLEAGEECSVAITDEQVEIEYGKFSIDPMIRYKEDTIYKIVETDTAFLKVPALEKQALVKSLEEKAKEAAHQIFKLRKRRFKILTANFEVLPPDGKAYEVIVKELGQLEHEYLSLFIGKKASTQKSYQFSYTPEKGKNGDVIFRMSPQMGPVGVNDLGGRPIRIDLKDLKVTDKSAVFPVSGTMAQAQISYRIPGMADISISNGKTVLLKTRMPIAQFGTIASIPAEILLNEGYSIEFYPELGSIKNVSK